MTPGRHRSATVFPYCSGNFFFSRDTVLEDFTLDRMAEDLDAADERMNKLLGVQPKTFAYPCGQTFVGRGVETRSYVPLIAERYIAGRGYLSESHNLPGYCDLAQLCSYRFDTDPEERFISRIEQAAEDGGWVVFTGHDVGTSGYQDISAEKLHAVCRYLDRHRDSIWTDTIAAVADHILRNVGRSKSSDRDRIDHIG